MSATLTKPPTATPTLPSGNGVHLPPLADGDVLPRGEFLRRWEAMPDLKFAERLEGVVHLMPSPVSAEGHAFPDNLLAWWLVNYQHATPGTRSYGNATVLIDFDNDVQPDQALIVLPEHGGQTRRQGKYLGGAPELVAEVAHSTAARDRGVKKEVYRRNSVREYLIWRTDARLFEAFNLDEDTGLYAEMPLEAGVWKSGAFPGLWLDLAALLAGDGAALKRTAEAGLASAEHGKFVAQVAARTRAGD